MYQITHNSTKHAILHGQSGVVFRGIQDSDSPHIRKSPGFTPRGTMYKFSQHK